MPSEKQFTAQTVRVPKELEKPLGYLLVDSGESFQALVLRLIRQTLKGVGSTPLLPQTDNSSAPQGEQPEAERTPFQGTANKATGMLQGTHSGTNPTAKELPWVSKTIRVLRSKKPGLPGALKSNLIQFEDSANEWDERQNRSHTSSTPSPSEPRGPGSKRAPVGAAGRDRTGIDELLARVDATLDEIEAAQKRGDAGKSRAHGKTG